MICPYCIEFEYFLSYEANVLCYEKADVMSSTMKVFFTSKSIEHKCTKCGSILSAGELYIPNEDDFKEHLYDELANILMQHIVCCEECGTGDEIRYMQYKYEKLMKDDEDKGYPSPIRDTSREVGDLASELEYGQYGDEIISNVIDRTYCPKCGNGSGEDFSEKRDFGKFCDSTEVYTQSDVDEFEESFYGQKSKAQREIEDIANHASFDEIQAMERKIIAQGRFQTYSLPVFGKIEAFLQTVFQKKEYYIIPQDRTIYHLRNNDVKKPLYTAEQMWAAPYSRVKHGRYNDVGEPVLYSSNNPRVLPLEVPAVKGQFPNMATMLVKKQLCLFPVNRFFGGEYIKLVAEAVNDREFEYAYKRQYIVTNIIATIARKVGYDGTAYISTKDRVSTNYAFFDFVQDKKLTIIDIR